MRHSILLMLIIPLILSGCTTTHTAHKERVCKALTDTLDFKKNTSNIQRSEIVRTELPLAARDYDMDGCPGGIKLR